MDRLQGPKGVIIQSAVDWNFLKQRAHHLSEELARLGLHVLFIENTGTRVPGSKDIGRLWNRLRRILRRGSKMRLGRREPAVEVLSPTVLPFPFLPVVQSYNRRYLTRRIKTFLSHHELESQDVAMITYMATPVAVDLALNFPWFAVAYDVVSDPKYVEPRVRASEERLLREAGLVLFASDALRRSYGGVGNFKTFRDGFTIELAKQLVQIPEAIKALPSPRLIYIGGLNKKLWVPALDQLARAFPSASILLVGPLTPGEVRLPQRSNVHLFPAVSDYRDLAGYLRAADLALIPYVPDTYVSPMYPAKLNEYLVFGLPIVATATTELSQLATEIGPNNVYLSESAQDFPLMAERALREDTPSRRERRIAYASARTWAGQTEALLQMLDSSSLRLGVSDKGRSAP